MDRQPFFIWGSFNLLYLARIPDKTIVSVIYCLLELIWNNFRVEIVRIIRLKNQTIKYDLIFELSR